jgi:hypothetical protein
MKLREHRQINAELNLSSLKGNNDYHSLYAEIEDLKEQLQVAVGREKELKLRLQLKGILYFITFVSSLNCI